MSRGAWTSGRPAPRSSRKISPVWRQPPSSSAASAPDPSSRLLRVFIWICPLDLSSTGGRQGIACFVTFQDVSPGVRRGKNPAPSWTRTTAYPPAARSCGASLAGYVTVSAVSARCTAASTRATSGARPGGRPPPGQTGRAATFQQAVSCRGVSMASIGRDVRPRPVGANRCTFRSQSLINDSIMLDHMIRVAR